MMIICHSNEIYRCKCNVIYLRRVACSVFHSQGDCCHYNESRVGIGFIPLLSSWQADEGRADRERDLGEGVVFDDVEEAIRWLNQPEGA